MPLSRSATAHYWQDHGDIDRIDLLLVGDTNGLCQAPFAQALRERRGQPISSIGQYVAEADSNGADVVDLRPRDLGLGPVIAPFCWHPGPVKPRKFADPALEQEQVQADHDRHFCEACSATVARSLATQTRPSHIGSSNAPPGSIESNLHRFGNPDYEFPA